jgi:hypothetical protein
MANYFYTDANGHKQCPVSEQQLKELATKGIIGPRTPMETDTGHKGVAEQIPGLFPAQAAEKMGAEIGRAAGQAALQAGQAAIQIGQAAVKTSIYAWLTDFAFRNMQPETFILWFWRIVYVIGLLLETVLFLSSCGLCVLLCGSGIEESRGTSLLLLLILLPINCIGFVLGMFFWRFTCEMGIVMFNGIIELAKLIKATRIYVENKNKETEPQS